MTRLSPHRRHDATPSFEINGLRPHYLQIYQAVAAIPRGRVASYGQIAARAGLPRRARLVGRALRETPDGLKLPWYRVVRADGRIALAEDSDAYRTQIRHLHDEGVAVTNGRVALAQHGLDHELDRALWGLCDLWGIDRDFAKSKDSTLTRMGVALDG